MNSSCNVEIFKFDVCNEIKTEVTSLWSWIQLFIIEMLFTKMIVFLGGGHVLGGYETGAEESLELICIGRTTRNVVKHWIKFPDINTSTISTY